MNSRRCNLRIEYHQEYKPRTGLHKRINFGLNCHYYSILSNFTSRRAAKSAEKICYDSGCISAVMALHRRIYITPLQGKKACKIPRNVP